MLINTFQSKDTADATFSSQELQIIKFIAQDLSTQTIATKLNLSPHTINAHRKRILKKLGVRTPVGLVVQAYCQGLI